MVSVALGLILALELVAIFRYDLLEKIDEFWFLLFLVLLVVLSEA